MIKIVFYSLFIIFTISKLIGACKSGNCKDKEITYDLIQILLLFLLIIKYSLEESFIYIICAVLFTTIAKIILKKFFDKPIQKINKKIIKCRNSGTCFDPWKNLKK